MRETSIGNMIFMFGFADYIAEIATKGTYPVLQKTQYILTDIGAISHFLSSNNLFYKNKMEKDA